MFPSANSVYWRIFRKSFLLCSKSIPLNLIPSALALVGWRSLNGAFSFFLIMTIMSGIVGLSIVTRRFGIIFATIWLAVYASISLALILIIHILLQYFLGWDGSRILNFITFR